MQYVCIIKMKNVKAIINSKLLKINIKVPFLNINIFI